jgi:hypothetical protein
MTVASPAPAPGGAASVGHIFRLRPSAAAPALARSWIRWVCAENELPPPIERTLVFVAGELVAMSVRQVRAPLHLSVAVEEDRIVVRVLIRSARRPERVQADAVSASRGLQLVECVADACGDLETEYGYEMWATVGRRRGRRATRVLASTT